MKMSMFVKLYSFIFLDYLLFWIVIEIFSLFMSICCENYSIFTCFESLKDQLFSPFNRFPLVFRSEINNNVENVDKRKHNIYLIIFCILDIGYGYDENCLVDGYFASDSTESEDC